MNLEEIENHVEGVDLSDFKPGGKALITPEQIKSAPAEVLTKICSTYQKVRPILLALSESWFLPKKWRDIIKGFMSSLDVICPSV